LEGFTVTILTSILGAKAFGLLFFLWQAAAASPAADSGTANAADTFSIPQMIKSMGGVAIAVVIVLLIMSVSSVEE
jgi:hypothetical protein